VKVNVTNDYTLFCAFGVDLKQIRTTHMPTQTFAPLSSNNSWYRYWYSVSVSEQAKIIGIGSIGKLWYRSHPTI